MVFAPCIRIAKINTALSACRIIPISIELQIFFFGEGVHKPDFLNQFF